MSYKWSGDQTFGTANVGILNADTIRGVSSTSNMSIGANLNGGSISIGGINSSTKILGPLFADTINSSSTTLNIGNNISTLNLNIGTNLSSGVINIGSINKTTNISGIINMSGSVNINTSGSATTTIGNILSTTNISGSAINIADTGLSAAGRVKIATGTNTTGSEMFLGSETLSYNNIRANIVHINDTGVSATGKVHIASGVNGANAAGSEVYIGSTTLTKCYIRAGDVYINEGTGNTTIGNTNGILKLLTAQTLITNGAGNSIYDSSLVTISTKNGYRSDGLTIQTKIDGNWLISFLSTSGTIVKGKITSGSDSSVAYETTSDRRLKKNIQPMDSMMENIMRMNPCSFQWISSDEIGYGFIAQETYEIFPQLRTKHPSCEDSCDINPCDCSGNPVYYGIDYGKFTPYIVKALQEMKISYDAKLQEQSDQITQLMARVAALETS